MNRFILSLIIFSLLTGYFISCTCKTNVKCDAGGPGLVTVGFTMTDIDSLLLISYKADNNFDSVIDTQRDYNNGDYPLRHDTGYLDVGTAANTDYKLIFPTLGDIYTITNIKIGGPSSKEMKYNCEEGSYYLHCNDYLVSYMANGQLQPGSPSNYFMIK